MKINNHNYMGGMGREMTLDDMDKTAAAQLSRRERQIMDALFEAGELSAQDVLKEIRAFYNL